MELGKGVDRDRIDALLKMYDSVDKANYLISERKLNKLNSEYRKQVKLASNFFLKSN